MLLAEQLGLPQEKLERMLRRLDARDVSRDAPVSGDSMAPLVDLLPADTDVTLDTSGYSASFANKNVGADKVVTVTGLAATDAGSGKAANYTVDQPAYSATGPVNENLLADITVLSTTGSINAANKVYDGSAAATATKVVDDKVGSDAVTLGGTASFASPNDTSNHSALFLSMNATRSSGPTLDSRSSPSSIAGTPATTRRKASVVTQKPSGTRRPSIRESSPRCAPLPPTTATCVWSISWKPNT